MILDLFRVLDPLLEAGIDTARVIPQVGFITIEYVAGRHALQLPLQIVKVGPNLVR
jgi:hypothetical protein